MKTKSLSLLTSLILGLGVAISANAKTFVYCSEGSPEGFDPSLYTAGTTFDASSRPVFNRLVEFEHGSTKIVPGLAEKWDISKDGLSYSFTLRKGVKFHSNDKFKPTRDMNADDIVFSFERQWKKENPWFNYAGGNYDYFSDVAEVLDKVEKIDNNTVKFVLKQPSAPFIANLAIDAMSIQSKEYADYLDKNNNKIALNQEPVGTGPFQFVGYQKDAVIRYKANDNYWRGKPKIDDLVYSITKDAAVRYQKLKAGECHLMNQPNPADIAAMKADSSLKVLDQEGLNVGYFAYNTLQKPFDNVNVRRALNMAINKQAIIDAVYNGTGVIAKNPIPPTIWSYNKNTRDDEYNPTKAKEMLDKEGVKGLKLRVWWMPVSRPYNPNAKRMAELIQADFKAIGVEVELFSTEWAEYLKISKDKNRDGAILLGWTGDNGDPDNFLNTLLGCQAVGGNNRAQWCYQPFDDVVTKAGKVTDVGERTKLYETAQLIFKEQAPWATIAHSRVFKPMRKEVEGFKISPFGSHDFQYVELK